MAVKSRAAAEVEDSRIRLREGDALDEPDMRVDLLCLATGAIVGLRQMLSEHASAEVGIIPRDRTSLHPGLRRDRETGNHVGEVHWKTLALSLSTVQSFRDDAG
jgi:hypothetical protein